MKRILFLTNYPSPYRVNFFDELGKYAQVTVLFTRSPEEVKHRSSDWFQKSQGRFQAVQLKQTLAIGKEHLCLEILKWLRKPYDAIIVCGYGYPTNVLAMLALRIMGRPCYLEVDGGLIRQDKGPKYALKRFLIRLAGSYLSTGKSTTEYLVHYGADPARVQEYPFSSLYEQELLPRVPSPEEKAAIRGELGMGEEQIVLSIGQFIHRKGFDILLQAASEMSRKIGFYIVGAEATQEYQTLRQELELPNVHFVGFKKKDELREYYRAADLFVLPTREDIWGLVVNEAMAHGLPVIATDRCVAGLELVDEGVNGAIVPVENARKLAEAMEDILGQEHGTMGAAALKKIRYYTLENMARVHMEILEKGRK